MLGETVGRGGFGACIGLFVYQGAVLDEVLDRGVDELFVRVKIQNWGIFFDRLVELIDIEGSHRYGRREDRGSDETVQGGRTRLMSAALRVMWDVFG